MAGVRVNCVQPNGVKFGIFFTPPLSLNSEIQGCDLVEPLGLRGKEVVFLLPAYIGKAVQQKIHAILVLGTKCS